MKKIAFCSDGTWDHPKSTTEVSTTDSNVYKLYKAMPTTATQAPRYDDGVGSDGLPIGHLLGGAFGTGLWAKVKEGYTKIMHDYTEGDEIYLFGFSRGAYTARSIAGMLSCCGMPEDPAQGAIDEGFDVYRMKPGTPERAAAQAALAKKYGNKPVTIRMIGVWDTVGSLGIPSLIGQVDPILYGFLDAKLGATVKSAYQALAIDEKRKAFPPTLWEVQNVPGQVVEQVWFTGCHSNIGGGYPDAGLSDITLKWMMGKCIDQGLEIDPTVWAKYKDLDANAHGLDVLQESWSVLWGLPDTRKIPPNASIASSVASRLQHIAAYSPRNLILTAARALAAEYQQTTV